MKINIDKKFYYLSFNARLLLKELSRRNVNIIPIKRTDAVIAKFKNHTEIIHDVFTTQIPYPEGTIADDKYLSKKILSENGIKTAPGEVFSYKDLKNAIKYANKIGFPVVLKPTTGSHGDHIFLNINDEIDLKIKIENFTKNNYGNGYFLVEKEFNANEFRLFITKRGFFACVARIPANVIGDGKKTLLQLINEENFRRMNPRDNCLCEIRVDEITIDYLNKNNLTLEYIPKKNERVFLRFNSNVSTGGNCIDATDIVHKDYIILAREILNLFENIPFIGIDLLCQDISIKSEDYIVCELNTAAGLSLHMLPEKGKSRNVAKAIVDVLFPESI